MNINSNKRNFDRFPLEFEMEVVAKDIEGKGFKEKTVLIDISGGGAKFTSRLADNYYLGQPLKLTINFLESDVKTSRVEGNATVVRINKLNDSVVNNKDQVVSIAITLDTALQFGTVDMKS